MIQESRADGAAVQQWDWWGENNQKWQAIAQPDGTIVRALHSGKYLDVSGKGMGNGAVLQQCAWLAGDNQKWFISPV